MQRHLPHILLALALLPALAGCQFLFGPDSTESAPQAVAIRRRKASPGNRPRSSTKA